MGRAYSNGFDAHTHLDFTAFEGDRDAVCHAAREAGVRQWAIAGADPNHWARVIEVAEATGGVAILGIHPWWVAALDASGLDAAMARLAALLTPHGLGECGLDRICARSATARAWQRDVLRPQLALARERDVPLVLHCARAHGDLLRVLREDGVPAAGGMVHRWSGAPELVPAFVALGLHLSFGPALRHEGATRLHRALREVPTHRLLLETDCPDQPLGDANRGTPIDLIAVAEYAAALREVSAETLLEVTGDNARRLFRAPSPSPGSS